MHELRNALLNASKLRPKAFTLPSQWTKAQVAARKAFHRRSPVTQWLIEHDLKYDNATFTKLMFEEKEEKGVIDVSSVSEKAAFLTNMLPLPITHSDALDGLYDTECFGACGWRVGEAVEQVLLYGGMSLTNVDSKEVCKIHGIFSHPLLNYSDTVKEGIALLKERKFYGPYIVVCSHDKIGNTFPEVELQPCLDLEGISAIVATACKPDDLALVQVTTDVIRMVIAQKLIVIEWEGKIKTLCCMVPQLRTDFHNNLGIVKIKQRL